MNDRNQPGKWTARDSVDVLGNTSGFTRPNCFASGNPVMESRRPKDGHTQARISLRILEERPSVKMIWHGALPRWVSVICPQYGQAR
jgi:hypothetical protein